MLRYHRLFQDTILHFHKILKGFQSLCNSMVLVILSLSILYCQEKPSYQDAFQERILLQYFLAPPVFPEQECSLYFQAQSECLSQTTGWNLSFDNGNTILPPTPEVLAGVLYLSVMGEPPTNTSLEGICEEIVNQALRTQFTRRAMGCYFSCLKDSWKSLTNTNSCNQEASNLYTPEREREKSRFCIQKCSSVNNTDTFF